MVNGIFDSQTLALETSRAVSDLGAWHFAHDSQGMARPYDER